MIRSTMWKLRILYSYAHYITIYRMVDRCYIIFIGSRSDLSSAMASRWRMEAVQQRTSLLVHMSHRNGPNTQLCRICREKYVQCIKNIYSARKISTGHEKYLQCMKNIFATPALICEMQTNVSTTKASVFPFESL